MCSRSHNQLEYKFMAETAQIELLPAQKVAQETHIVQAPNGVCYAQFGDTHLPAQELERIVQAVPSGVAAALKRRAYYFVPLTISEEDTTLVAPAYTIDFSDRAICHRNVRFGNSECIFISTRLMQDRFALALSSSSTLDATLWTKPECRRAFQPLPGLRCRLMSGVKPAMMPGSTAAALLRPVR